MNFKVIDGKAVGQSQAVTPFDKTRKEDESTPTAEPQSLPPYNPVNPPVQKHSSSTAARPFWLRWLQPTKPPREISCFDCDHSFLTIGGAQSSQCPKCGRYVNLIDYQIDEHWNRWIQTRGDVTVLKHGRIEGTTIRCHHLTVIGKLAGSADCSGDLIIRSHGKITGNVRCRNLRIEKGARVEFLHPVTATTASIDGQVRGQISCTGSVTLEKRAQLHGLVRTSSLIVKAGAKHSGMIEMVNTSDI